MAANAGKSAQENRIHHHWHPPCDAPGDRIARLFRRRRGWRALLVLFAGLPMTATRAEGPATGPDAVRGRRRLRVLAAEKPAVDRMRLVIGERVIEGVLDAGLPVLRRSHNHAATR